MTDYFLKTYGPLAAPLEALGLHSGLTPFDFPTHSSIMEGEYQELPFPCFIICFHHIDGFGNDTDFQHLDRGLIERLAPSALVTSKRTLATRRPAYTIATKNEDEFSALKSRIFDLFEDDFLNISWHPVSSNGLVHEADIKLYWSLTIANDIDRAIHASDANMRSITFDLRSAAESISRVSKHKLSGDYRISDEVLETAQRWLKLPTPKIQAQNTSVGVTLARNAVMRRLWTERATRPPTLPPNSTGRDSDYPNLPDRSAPDILDFLQALIEGEE